MRRFLLACLGLFAASVLAAADSRPATPDEVALFKDAMKNSSQDKEHWAYTETTIIKEQREKAGKETVVRFDPSKPYGEQFTPLKIEGKPPTERQLKKYRKQGEQRGEKVAKAAAARAGQPPDRPPQLSINDSKAALDVDHPLVVQDEPGRITFEVPLLLEKGADIPVDKIQILVEVGKLARQVERAIFRVREAFRMKLVAKIKSGEATAEFTVVDPNFGPVITSVTGSFGASFLFIPVNATLLNTRTDWQRVKAFDERFSVKLAPLEVLGF